MNTRNTTLLSSALLIVTLSYSQPSKADGLTGREFASHDIGTQNGYITTSVVMAGFIAGQVDPQKASCITDWFYRDARGVEAKKSDLRAAIALLPDYHPSATLLSIVQKACGKFGQ